MNEYINHNYKNIINGLILVIILLIGFIIYTLTRFGNIPLENIEKFTDTLQREDLKIHGVLLLTREKPNDIVTFNSGLYKKAPCAVGDFVSHKTSDYHDKPNDDREITITVPKECQEQYKDFEFDINNPRPFLIVPSKIKGVVNEFKNESKIEEPNSVILLFNQHHKVTALGHPCGRPHC
jgi:hypothetical protein